MTKSLQHDYAYEIAHDPRTSDANEKHKYYQRKGTQKIHEKIEDAKRKEAKLDNLAERVGFEPGPTGPSVLRESVTLIQARQRQPAIPEGSLEVAGIPGPIPSKAAIVGQGEATAYTSGTGLSQPLTQMFKIHQENRAATADIHSANEELKEAENDVVLKVSQLYYGILIAQLKGEAAKAEADAAQVKLQENTSPVEEGSAMEVVVLDSRAATLDAKETVLKQSLQVRDLTLELNNLLGLPLNTKLQVSEQPFVAPSSITSREECVRIAREQSPDVRTAKQAVERAKAELAVGKYAYIPDVTAFARYSYQSGIPFLVHNFGDFGAIFEYELFDGGRRKAEIGEARTKLSQAEVNLDKEEEEEEVAVEVEIAYDKVEQMLTLVTVAEEVLKARTEGARIVDSQFEQGVDLASADAEAVSKMSSAKASLLEANVGLSLAQAELKRVMGELPR
ncbi:MAG TPA: TolC family protein [Terriglobia bacterium]